MNIGKLGALVLAGAAFTLGGSCARRKVVVAPNSCALASVQMREAWTALQAARSAPDGCQGPGAARCEQWRLQIDRLGQSCPGDQQTLLINAALAYDDRQIPQAQQYLDTLLANPHANPEAAVLRARIALEEGNLPFALRFLADQTRLTGDHPDLRETYASALFLHGDFGAASGQLDLAERLGAPIWRVEYGRGLIAEGEQDLNAARGHFEKAAAARPDWGPPRARLRTLEAGPGR